MAIPEKTQACVSSLKDLRDLSAASQAEKTWAEDQLARLNLWADSLGVFAQGGFSVNRRFAKNQQVAHLVEQLLDALLGNIEAYRNAIVQDSVQLPEQRSVADSKDDTVSDNEELSASEMSEESDMAPNPAKLAAATEDSVGRLLQLAVRVRREGANRTALEAAKFEPTDDNRRPLAPEFEQYSSSICQRVFRTTQPDTIVDQRQLDGIQLFETAPFLKERAQKCMMNRWRRISYQRHHASNLADPSQKTMVKPETQRPQTKPAAAPLVNRASARVQALPGAEESHVPVATKAISAATSLPAHVRIDQNKDLHPKTAPTVTTKVRANHLEYPRPPKVREGLDKFKCPLCGLLLSTKLLDKKDWQTHVMKDLMPYFCLFEQCTQPYLTFQSSEDWLNHAKAEHARLTWVCQICRSSGSSKEVSSLQSETDYRQHLEQHHSSIPASELALVIQMSCRQESPVYLCCAFCGFVPETHLQEVENEKCQKEITDHMAKHHLQSLALDSIPWDVTGGEHADSGRVSGSSEMNSQDEDIKQQIMSDPQLRGFELSALEIKISREQDAEIQHVNIYTASLDEIGRRSSVKTQQGPENPVGEWCSSIRAVGGQYILAKRDELLGTDIIAISWASTDAAAPETVVRVEGPQNYAPDRIKDESRQRRRQSVVPPAIEDAPEVVENIPDNVSLGSDDVSENVLTQKEKQFFELVSCGDLKSLVDFLSKCDESFDADCTDVNGCNAVHLAVLNSHPSLIEVLVEAGSDVDCWSADFGAPLYLAVLRENVEVAEALLHCSADIDESSPGLGTSLHAACFSQNEALVRLLLDHDANVNESDFVNCKRVLKLQSLEADAGDKVEDTKSIESRSIDSSASWKFPHYLSGTPLSISALFGDAGLVQLLLDNGALVEADAEWSGPEDQRDYDRSPLGLACRAGKSEVVKTLLNAGANIDRMDIERETPALSAVYSKSLETLKLLVHHVPGVEERRKHFVIPLQEASARGFADIVRLFLENGVDPDWPADNDTSPLILASSSGHQDIVVMLLEFGASPDKTKISGDTALHCAAKAGYARVVQSLVASGSDVDLQDDDGETPLMASTEVAETACMRVLLENKTSVGLRDNEGLDALGYAAFRNRIEHVRDLLQHGAHIEALDNDGWTALMIAAAWDHDELVKLLIERRANVNCQSENTLDTPLLVAARNGARKCAEVLLDHGAEPEARNRHGNTALFEASETNEPEVLRLLIERGCSIDGEDSEGDSVLLKTVNAGHIECLQILIEAGATPGSSHHVWNLALLLAARKGNVACLRLLLPKASPDSTNDDGLTGLMLAVSEGHLECARLLLDAKAKFDSVDPSGKTALHHAAAQCQLECTRLLLKQGTGHSSRDHDGRTPLLLLAAEEDKDDAEECVTVLVTAGASVNDMDDTQRTAIWLAAHEGGAAVLKALCSHSGCNKDALDELGQTALMFVAKSGIMAKVEALVAGGANVELQSSSDGRNALAFALGESYCQIAAVLLKAGSDLSMVVTATDSSILLMLKKGLDDMTDCIYGEGCRDLVKANLDKVTTQLEILKRALNPYQKQKLRNWLKSARQKLSSARKHKTVSFATIGTPELQAEAGSQSISEESSGSERQRLSSPRKHKTVSFEPVETPESHAEAGSQSVPDDSSDSEV